MARRPGDIPVELGKGKPEEESPAEPVKDVSERGAGTVTAIGICVVLLGFSVVALVLVQTSVAAVRAATAADLAALAGADALRGLGPAGGTPLPARHLSGIAPLPGLASAGDWSSETGALTGTRNSAAPGDACGVARRVAQRNGGVVSACTADAATGILSIETEVAIPALPVPATGRARAGPPG